MSREPPIRLLLKDMLDAAEAIERFTAGLDELDEKTAEAVRAKFITLGEATGRLPAEFRASHPGIPWDDIRRHRNFMVHMYDAIDPARMLRTVRTDLPVLRQALTKLCDQLTG